MNIWIVKKVFDYEGFIIDSVWDSEEKANAEVQRIKDSNKGVRFPGYDSLEIEEHLVQ